MGWSIQLGEGTDAFTIDENGKFDLDIRAADSNNGNNDFVETYVEIEGDAVDQAGDPAVVASKISDIIAELVEKQTPRKVTLILDGTPWRTYEATDSLGSPKVTRFRTIPDDGGGKSHWRYGLSLYIKSPGSNADGAMELSASVREVRENGKLIRKVWRASAAAFSLTGALSIVMKFKPSSGFITEDVEKFPIDRKVAAEWEWEIGKQKTADIEKGVTDIEEEPIEITDFGADFVPDEQAGLNVAPILHVARRKAAMIRVRGRVRGLAPGLTPPSAHFTESEELRRAPRREGQYYEAIEKGEAGQPSFFVLPYDEVWIFTGDTLPTPNHGSHQPTSLDAPEADEPGDGGIDAL